MPRYSELAPRADAEIFELKQKKFDVQQATFTFSARCEAEGCGDAVWGRIFVEIPSKLSQIFSHARPQIIVFRLEHEQGENGHQPEVTVAP